MLLLVLHLESSVIRKREEHGCLTYDNLCEVIKTLISHCSLVIDLLQGMANDKLIDILFSSHSH